MKDIHEEIWYQSHQPGTKAQVDSFRRLERLHLPENMNGYRVLDLGCNEGFFCNQAALRGASEVIGIDIDEKFLSRARLLYGSNEKIKFLRQSWRELPEGKFDLILWTSGMHYEINPYPVLRNIASRLKPSGIFILECGVHPNQGSEMIRSTRHDGTFWYPTKGYLEFMLRKSGFAFRVVSEPEQVGLDPVPRAVYHCNLLKPNLLLIVGESNSGKSFLANQLSSMATKTIFLDWFISRIAGSNWAHTRLERFIKESIDKYNLKKTYTAIDECGFTEEYIKQILLGISTNDELVVVEGFMTQLQIETFRRLAGNFANIWIVQRQGLSEGQVT